MDLQEKKAAILDALLEHEGIGHVMSAASRVMGNPILMVDRLGTYAGFSHTEEYGDAYWTRFNKALPFDKVVEEVDEKGLAARLMESDAVLRERFDLYDRDVYGTRVRDRVDVLGYVSMVLERPLQDDDEELMVALARMLAVELVYQSQHVSWRDKDSELVQGLLARGKNEDELAIVAGARGIGDGRQMRLVCVCYAPAEEVSVFFAKSSLDMNVDALLCGVHERQVILLVDNDARLPQRLAGIERCCGGCEGVGVSLPFANLASFAEAREQALCAIRLAWALDWEGLVHRYDRTLAYRVIETAIEHVDALQFVEPGVLRVLSYDEQNGTELAETLRTFVDAGRNMNACARRLYTHRNTVHYRLKRIYELLGVEAIDDELAFSIALSFRILSLSPVR